MQTKCVRDQDLEIASTDHTDLEIDIAREAQKGQGEVVALQIEIVMEGEQVYYVLLHSREIVVY
jgi:hypothetical protein